MPAVCMGGVYQKKGQIVKGPGNESALQWEQETSHISNGSGKRGSVLYLSTTGFDGGSIICAG